MTAAEGGRTRQLRGIWYVVAILLTSAATLASICYIQSVHFWGRVIMLEAYLGLLAACILPLVYLLFPASHSMRDKVPWYDILLGLLSAAGPLFVFFSWEELATLGWQVSPPLSGIILGVITWALVLEAARRTAGFTFAAVVGIISIYPLFAGYAPGFLQSRNLAFDTLVGIHMFGPDSIFGLTTRVMGTIVVFFLVFAVVVQQSGGGKFITDFAMSFVGHIRGGGAKASIVASAMFGSLSGSPISNVATTGAVTIPLMKKSGYKPHYAGAVEAAASTGGAVMPPVMGATGFLIAEMLQIPYATVALAAAIPAILYFIGIFAQTDFQAAKMGIKGLPRQELPSLADTLKAGWFYILPVLVFIWFLFVQRWHPGKTALIASALLIGLAMLRKETRLNLPKLGDMIVAIGRLYAEVGAILAAAGMVIGSLGVSGAAAFFSSQMAALGAGHLWAMLVVAAAVSFILGMGLTISACYVLLAVLIGPAIMATGVYPLAGHLFFLYWGLMSYITPPVALAAFTGAAMAGSSSFRTGLQAIRLGIVAFIVPFLFVYEPALILHGTPMAIFLSVITCILGIILMSSGIEGHTYILGNINWVRRLLLGAGGLALMIPGLQTDLIGAGIVALVIIERVIFRRDFKASE